MLYVEKRKNKQAGFTLVELIVAIAIMGILLIIALPQVRKIQSANKDRKYEAYQSSMERGAKLYIDSYSKDLFGNNDSGCIRIKYSDLKNKNLVKDFSGKNIICSKDEETFVQVRKVRDEYQYASSIVCRDSKRVVYQDGIDTTFSCDNKPDEDSPLIEVNPKESGWAKTKNLNIKIKITDVSGLDSNLGIAYYFKTSTGTKVGKSYTYAYKNKKGITSIQYQIPTSHLPKESNQYYLVIEPFVSKTTSGVQDVLGNDVTSSSTFGLYKIDNVAPTCGTVTGASTTWTNKDKTVSVGCSDDASGCRQGIYSKDFSSTTMVYSFTIEDEAGNINSCPVNVYLDTKAPSCGTITGSSTSWTSSDRTIGVTCNDTDSGCKQSNYSQTFSTTTKTANMSIYDKAGNKTVCSVNVYVDKSKNGWILEGCWYYYANNQKLVGWQNISGYWYYFDSSGCMKTGWVQDRTSYPSCKSGWWYFDDSGRMVTGWKKVGSSWYYMAKGDGKEGLWSSAQPSGCMYTGWVYSEDFSCATHGWYFADSGAMLSNTTINGSKLDAQGCWVKDNYGTNNCNIRGSSLRSQSYSWRCTRGHTHSTGYTHYCSDSSGTLHTRASNPSLVTYSWICPSGPYGPADGWIIVND